MQELFNKLERLESMGQTGYLRMSGEFTIANNVRTTQALYDKVLAS